MVSFVGPNSNWVDLSISSRDNKQVYEDLKEQLSKLSRSLKVLETRALKHNFSTSELTSKVSQSIFKIRVI